MYTPPPDFVPLRTADGSFTLRSEVLHEQYHSRHGALQESRHVFLEAGLRARGVKDIDLLEVGLGTGLNALLTWIAAEQEGLHVRYTALEPFPLPMDLLAQLDHAALCGHPEKKEAFLGWMNASEGRERIVSERFRFTRRDASVLDLEDVGAYDLVYFDSFGPEVQPELWTAEVFHRLHRAMRSGAALVTYCAKGDVRRAMQSAGFRVERLPGPPGKREMMRATRP